MTYLKNTPGTPLTPCEVMSAVVSAAILNVAVLTGMSVSTWGVALTQVALVLGDRVLVGANGISTEVDEVGRNDFEEIYKSARFPGRVAIAHIGTCSRLSGQHVCPERVIDYSHSSVCAPIFCSGSFIPNFFL